jgi:hypothetical protein
VQSSEQSSAASSPEPKLVVAVAHGRAPGRRTPSERHGGGVLRGGHRRCTAPLASLRHPATIAGGRARPGPSRFRALEPGVAHLLSGNAAWRRCTGRWMPQRSALLSTPLCTRPTCWRHATSAPATAKEEQGAGAGEASVSGPRGPPRRDALNLLLVACPIGAAARRITFPLDRPCATRAGSRQERGRQPRWWCEKS